MSKNIVSALFILTPSVNMRFVQFLIKLSSWFSFLFSLYCTVIYLLFILSIALIIEVCRFLFLICLIVNLYFLWSALVVKCFINKASFIHSCSYSKPFQFTTIHKCVLHESTMSPVTWAHVQLPVVRLRGKATFSAVVLDSRFSPATRTVSNCMPKHVPHMGK